MAANTAQKLRWIAWMGFLATLALALYFLSGSWQPSERAQGHAVQQPPASIAGLRRQVQGRQQQQQLMQQQPKQRLRVDAPLPALPPFEPTCLVRFEKREQVGCPPMNCSLAEACSMDDTSCCAYFNRQMLGDLQRLLHAKGLQGEYAAVYGTALGAERDQAVMGHTHDVDIGFTPTALQVLAQNATREELWRQGYVLWHDRYQWRICPHNLHPAPEFRAAMVPNMTHKQWQKQAGNASGVYTDGYLMYPLPDGGSCVYKSLKDLEAAISMVLQPTSGPLESVSGMAATDSRPDMPGSWQQQQVEDGDSAAQPARRFCLQLSRSPVEIRAGGRQARVGDVNLTTLENLEAHLVSAYGDSWQVPDISYHGITKNPADFWAVQEALLARLAATAWGNVTLPERADRCSGAPKKQSTAASEQQQSPPPEDTVAQPGQGSEQQSGEEELAAVESRQANGSLDAGLGTPVLENPARGRAPQQLPNQTQQAELEPGLPYLATRLAGHSCTSPVSSKQSCMFHNVCFVLGPGGSKNLTVLRLAGSSVKGLEGADALLQQQLDELLDGLYSVQVIAAAEAAAVRATQHNNSSNSSSSMSDMRQVAASLLAGNVQYDGSSGSTGNSSAQAGAVRLTRNPDGNSEQGRPQLLWEDKLTVISNPGINQYSFGHALVNTLAPLFMMVTNHVQPEELSPQMRMLFAAGKWGGSVLPALARATISQDVDLLPQWLGARQQDTAGVCFRNLLLGDGGYIGVAREMLGGRKTAKTATNEPTAFDSKTWELFKRHAFRVSGILTAPRQRPLVLLNDKRFNKNLVRTPDSRSILEIDALAANISAAYPAADVLAVKFLDMPMVEQLQLMSAASVYITTAGSSSMLAAFMPAGGRVILVGSPEGEAEREAPWMSYTAFNELDRLFPLTYVQFQRYAIDVQDTGSYVVKPELINYKPTNMETRDRWLRYNADVRVDMARLRPMLDQALGL